MGSRRCGTFATASPHGRARETSPRRAWLDERSRKSNASEPRCRLCASTCTVASRQATNSPSHQMFARSSRNHSEQLSSGVLGTHQGRQGVKKGVVVVFLCVTVVPEPSRTNKPSVAVATEPLCRRDVGGTALCVTEQRDGVALDAAALAVRAGGVRDFQPEERHLPNVGANPSFQVRFGLSKRLARHAQSLRRRTPVGGHAPRAGAVAVAALRKSNPHQQSEDRTAVVATAPIRMATVLGQPIPQRRP